MGRAEKKNSPLNKFSAVWIYFLGNKSGSTLNYRKKQENISPQEGADTLRAQSDCRNLREIYQIMLQNLSMYGPNADPSNYRARELVQNPVHGSQSTSQIEPNILYGGLQTGLCWPGPQSSTVSLYVLNWTWA